MKDLANPLISVVLPVYNVEKYLRDCLNSVINQTYSNLEIICINDASTDNSGKILSEYAQKDNRIKIINNKSNLKAGLTRNIGIENARGEYIHFLDADDWIDINAYQKLVEIISQNQIVDFINFSYVRYINKINKRKITIHQCKFNELIDISSSKVGISDVHIAPWAKIVRTNVLRENNIRFNNFECHEDFEYTIKLLLASKTTYFANEFLIFYRKRPNSLVSQYPNHVSYVLETVKEIYKLTKAEDDDIRIPIMNYAYNNLLESVFDLFDKKKINYKKMQEIFQENIDFNIVFDKRNSKEPLRERLRIVLNYNADALFKTKYYIKQFFPCYFSIYIRIKNVLFKK